MKKYIILTLALLAIACRPCKPVGELTGALDSETWDCSEWISAADAAVIEGRVTDKINCRAADGASWFLSTVENEKKVVSAKWMTAGLGVFELFLNGKPVGEEILKPGFTHYAKTKYSFTYDITEAFAKGRGAVNVLSAQVTPGWWGDKIITPSRKEGGMIGQKCAFRSVLELTFADGTARYYGTDTLSWKAGIAGPVKHAAIFDGEIFDAREKTGFETPEKLAVPEVNTEFEGEILPTSGGEIYFRKDLALSPVKAWTWKDVEGADDDNYGKVVIINNFSARDKILLEPGVTLVVDFGQNASAVPAFIFKADEGTELTCLPGEILNDGNGAKSRGMDGPEGSVHRRNLRIPDKGMELKYTFGHGGKYVCYHPRYTFYGYRFISVTATSEVIIKSIESIPVSSITEALETGRIKTGDELVNKLISNTLWGQRSNYLSVTTDCPQRNERLGWTADTQVFTETGTFFADTRTFFHKWMRDMRDSQSETGGFPGVAPTAQYGNNMMRLGWADAGVIVPWTVWKQFGDTGIIDENWEAMEKFLCHIAETEYNHQLLSAENGNYQWADWLSYEPLESHGGSAFIRDAAGKRVPLPESIVYWNYLSLSYWIIDAEMMRDMALATGRDAAIYEAQAEKARSMIMKDFINEDGSFKLDILNTMQTPSLFALKNGVVSGQARENVISRLRDNFAAHGNCLQTGFLGTSILMATLTENGMEDIACDLLFQRKNPSWLYSVDNGATTIWERWNSYTIESGMASSGMNSFNHYAYGCVCAWIWESVAGIAADPAEPGFKHIVMKPVPDKRLGHVDASYRSATGLIKSSWRYEGDSWVWDFTVPEGSHATVTLPGESESEEYGPGSYTVRK